MENIIVDISLFFISSLKISYSFALCQLFSDPFFPSTPKSNLYHFLLTFRSIYVSQIFLECNRLIRGFTFREIWPFLSSSWELPIASWLALYFMSNSLFHSAIFSHLGMHGSCECYYKLFEFVCAAFLLYSASNFL